MIDRQAILEELKTVLAPYTENKEALNTLNDQTELIKDLKINSANLVDIVIDAESKYNIEIDMDSAEKMMTVGSCIDIINEKMEQTS
jgi:acyl carrier protein